MARSPQQGVERVGVDRAPWRDALAGFAADDARHMDNPFAPATRDAVEAAR